ncbi:MAG: pitrilysin family protein [Verrucomicrobiota bacterium]
MNRVTPATTYRFTRLENGLTVATAEMPHMTSVSLGIWAGVGSRYEPASLSGVSHFIEHMLFKGTKRRTPLAISQAVEGIGGYLNAFTSEETTCFYSRARHDRFEVLLEVLGDMFLHSRFHPADIQKEREVIKEELAMYLDDPAHHVQELLNATQWPEQPLGRSITGSIQTLNGIRRKELLQFLQTHYVADRTFICAAGRVKHAPVVRAVQARFRGLPRGVPSVFAPAMPRTGGCVIEWHTKDTEQTHLALGVRTCPRHDQRRYALRLLNVILGENMSSRLFQVVREDHGLAYSIQSSVSFFHDAGDLVIGAGLDAENLPKVVRLLAQELRRLKLRAPGVTELRRARDYVLGQIEMSQENTESQMMNLGEQLAGFGKVFPVAEVKRSLTAVTCSQIHAAASEFFHPERYTLALISPLKRIKGLEKLLVS